MRKLLLCLLISFLSITLQAAPSIVANQDWVPFAGKELKGYGLLSQIAEKAFALQGVEIEYQFLPFKEALQQSKLGKISATAAWSNVEWSDDYLYSEPLMKHDLVIYKRVYSPLEATPLTALYGKKVGVQKGQQYNKLLTTLIEKGKLEAVVSDSIQESFYKLLTGKVDFCVQTNLAAQATLKKHFTPSEINALNFVESQFSMAPSYLMFPANNPTSQSLLEKFNQGLETLKQDGSYARLIKAFIDDQL